MPSSPARRPLLALSGLALALALLPALPASAGGEWTFSGGGFGHSVGMSQFGAYGMARGGATWQEITGHYYTGSTAGPVRPELAESPLWVNLVTEKSTLTFTVRTTGSAPGVPARFASSAGALEAGTGDSVTIGRNPDGTCTTSAPSGSFTGDCVIDAEWDGWSGAPTTALVLAGCSLTNWNLTSGSRSQPCTYARGSLRLRPDNNTNTIDASVEIGMEDYLLGISEMPYYWGQTGGMAALEAQVVAARSYAYARVISRGAPERRPWCWCHLYDTPVDQSYVGWGHGTQEWIDAVRNTADQVLYHPAITRDGAPTPLNAFYSSSTFGRTENSEDAFTATLPYLRGVDDHYAGIPEVFNGNFRWTTTFTSSQLAARLPGMSTVTGATITRCSASGAALEVTFDGSGGPRTFHARQLRSYLGLRSQQIFAIGGSVPTASGCTEAPPSPTTTTTTAPTTTTTTVPDTATTTTVPVTTTSTTTTTVPATTTTTTTTVPATTTTTTTTVPATTTTTTVPATTTTTTVPATTTTTTTTTPGRTGACSLPETPIDALVTGGRTLRFGATGGDVAELQQVLAALGIYAGPIDGAFGSATLSAVKTFQRGRGLVADGIVGGVTRSTLVALREAIGNGLALGGDPSLLRRGSRGDSVKALQHLLSFLGYGPGPVDGSFGLRTDLAVTAFQRARSLAVDGVIGGATRAAIANALGIGDCR
ncbi:MAG: peptidoglycan-binding protein [Acidimicrobiia bacterium]|nr:MAG: peptidoglycan-binding protein [Acidimicrobiia bacterium]